MPVGNGNTITILESYQYIIIQLASIIASKQII